MKILRSLALALIAIPLLAAFPAVAQFGQNKVTYKRFDWKIYTSPHFNVHHYLDDERELQEVVSEAESAYLGISKFLDHELKDRVPLIVYKTHADFEQTNIILEEIPEAVGAFAEPFQNRMVVPIDEPSDKRYRLLRHELTHIFQYDILYAGSLKRAIRSRPPLWLMEGLASFIGDDEDSFDQMVIRDAVVNNLVPSVRDLDVLSFLTYRFGNAIFAYISQEYGKESVRTFLFEYRKVLLAQNLEKAFQDAFGIGIDAFDRRFARYLRQRYLPVLTTRRSPEDYGREVGLPRPGQFTFSPALSPSGELIAALATPGLELDVVILSAKDGKLLRNLTKGFTTAYEEVGFEAFNGKRDLAWSRDGNRLAFFVKWEKRRPLLIYDPTTGRRLERIVFKDLASCASPSFSPDGKWVAFSANLDGVWDIFRYNLETKELENMTRDEYYDSNPSWSDDGNKLLYNRRIGQFSKVFTVDVGTPERKTQLTGGAASDIQPSFSRDGQTVYFSSDRGEFGIFNLHRLDLTTGTVERLTDLVGGAFSPLEGNPAEDQSAQLIFTGYFAGTFRLYKMKLSGDEVRRAIDAGQAEPQTSPLAPSRREERERAKQPEAAPEPAPVEGEADADLEPFRPPLELRLDPDSRKAYRPKWDIDAPSITVGLADDGTFLSNTVINFTDLLGDQRIGMRFFTVREFGNIELSYLNLTGRLDWGAQVYDYRDYYVSGFSGTRVQRRQRYTSAAVFASYPFSRYTRVEGSVGYAQRRTDLPFTEPGNPIVQFQSFSDDYPFVSTAFVNDTTRYQSWGAFQGRRLRLGITGYKFTSGDSQGESIISYDIDIRGYQHVTRRSLVAARVYGVLQSGQRAGIYSLGGLNELRGYEFREFFGDNIVGANIEYRFPLFDAFRFAFGLNMAPVRGFLFADFGTAWFSDTDFIEFDSDGNFIGIGRGKATYDVRTGLFRKYTATEDGQWVDLKGSVGFGFTVPFFGLPFNWAFARQYDGEGFNRTGSQFYIFFEW